jgi:hypothetical protein
MAQMKALDMAINELRTAGQLLISAAETMSNIYGSRKPDPAPTTEAEPPPETAPPAPAEHNITKEAMRTLLAEKAEAGFRSEVKSLMGKYGKGNLTSVPAANYPALKAELEELT